MIHFYDAIGVLLGLACLGVFAAGFSFGKHRGELETRTFFLGEEEDSEAEAPEWDPRTAIVIEDGHALYDQRSQSDKPTLTLIEGGKGKSHEA